ncbi:hypothetical protein IGI04_042785, partial [Brassica rapa subsp. trilocularis]
MSRRRRGWVTIHTLMSNKTMSHKPLEVQGTKPVPWLLSDVSGSQEVFLVHHPSELKEEDFAHCVEQWRVAKEVVMRHWCEVSLKLTCKLGPILNPSLRRGVYLHDPRELGGYSRRGSNLLRSRMKDEEAISKAASSVEVIGEWLKHPHVAQATRWRLYKKKKQPRLSKRSCISKKRLIWCVRALQPNKSDMIMDQHKDGDEEFKDKSREEDDALVIPPGPITRAKARRLKEAVGSLLMISWKQEDGLDGLPREPVPFNDLENMEPSSMKELRDEIRQEIRQATGQ